MATDPDTGEWIDDETTYDITPSDNADDHGEIKQPEPQDGGGGGGGGSENGAVREDMMSRLGDLYTEGAYEEARHRDFDPGWVDRIVNKENLRADNDPNSEYHENGSGGYLTKSQMAPQSGGSKLLGSGGGSGGSSSSSSGGGSKMDDVYGYLKGLFPGGGFNQDIVNRRLDSVRGGLDANRKSTMANNEAYLADRGLLGSGPQATAAGNLDSRLFGQFTGAYNDIYATEAENADKRMMSALQTATGMSEAEAQNQIDWFRAQNEKDLGFGNLAARNNEADISKLLGLGNIDIGRQNAATGSYKAQTDYDIATKQIDQERRNYDEAVRNHDLEAADRAQQRINELEQIRSNGTHR